MHVSLIVITLLISQRVFTMQYLGQPTIVKERFSKKYRHPDLDAKITKERLAWVRDSATPFSRHSSAAACNLAARLSFLSISAKCTA